MRPEPVIVKRLASNSAMGILPHKILSCALRSGAGKVIGVLALFREDRAEPFADRDTRLAEILARKTVGPLSFSAPGCCCRS